MKYALLINIVIVLLVTVGSAFLVFTLQPGAKKNNAEKQVQKNVYAFESDRLKVSIEYPFIPGNSKSIVQANMRIRQEINKEVDEFRKGSLNFVPDEVPYGNIQSYFEGSATVLEQNERFISLVFDYTTFGAGAAHPSHATKTYVYDFKQEKFISTGDLFKAESNYLRALSVLSKEDLHNQSSNGAVDFTFDSSMLEEGTRPTQENFRHAVPSKDGLNILFSEYQVAPYVAGPQRVIIPYFRLKDMIDPNGIVGMYIQ